MTVEMTWEYFKQVFADEGLPETLAAEVWKVRPEDDPPTVDDENFRAYVHATRNELLEICS